MMIFQTWQSRRLIAWVAASFWVVIYFLDGVTCFGQSGRLIAVVAYLESERFKRVWRESGDQGGPGLFDGLQIVNPGKEWELRPCPASEEKGWKC